MMKPRKMMAKGMAMKSKGGSIRKKMAKGGSIKKMKGGGKTTNGMTVAKATAFLKKKGFKVVKGKMKGGSIKRKV